MKVLVIGSGGREHALVWKISQSPRVDEVFCAPGNGGIAEIASCVDCKADDLDGLLEFGLQNSIDLTVVGPEDPLTKGIVDLFTENGLRVFGPSAAAAELEGSKVFTKDFLRKYDIPTADYKVFTEVSSANDYIDRIGVPCVVKADGLAAGKGVVVAFSLAEAKKAVQDILADKIFGTAGNRVVVEEFLRGEEVSFLAFCDGETVLPLPSSQDHKAAYDGDKGPNTGGMGAYSPAPIMNEAMTRKVMAEVMVPTVRGMAAEGRKYKGVLYAGLMVDGDDFKVLEYNCRFGDPECQPLLMRLESDLVEVMEAVIDEKLADIALKINPQPAACVVMASEGYPGKYEIGKVISGLVEEDESGELVVFHAGTALQDGEVITSGGRVLGVTAMGKDLKQALDRVYDRVGKISWDGCFFRKDIGYRAL